MLEDWTRSLATMLLLLLTMAACQKPEWTDPEKSKASVAAPPPATAAPAAPISVDIPRTSEAPPANPAWLTALIGKSPRSVFPRTGVCQGNMDVVVMRYEGASPASKILGWGWDVGAKRAVGRVVLVDAGYRIVGGGEGGVLRPDVVATQTHVLPNAGWHAFTPLVSGPVDAYGVVEAGQAMCPLGHLVL